MIYLQDLFPLPDLDAMLTAGYVREQRHPHLPLRILNYTAKAAYDSVWNPVTMKCRGIIFDESSLRVIARPFPKFFNYGQPEAGELDLNAGAVVTDKLDGSLGILYPADHGYAIATRGSFTSEQALWASDWFARYADPTFFDASLCDSSQTYLFEILVGWNRIVCDYDWEGLALIAILDTDTGRLLDLPEDPGLLQARSPRDDPVEYLGASDERLEDVRGLPNGDAATRHRAPSRAAQRIPEKLGQEKLGAAQSAATPEPSEDPGRVERSETREALRRLHEDVPAGLHGLPSRPGDEGLQRGPSEDTATTPRGDREVRTGLRELPPHQNAFRIVDRHPHLTLGDALQAPPRPNAEGYVVHIPSTGAMVKLKQDDYVALHRIMTGTNARHVWEVAAVQACRLLIREPNHWASYLGIDPIRAEELRFLELDDWLAGVPDEFYEWIQDVIETAQQQVVEIMEEATRLVGVAAGIADRRERFESLKDNPLQKEIMRLASVGDAGVVPEDGWARVQMKAWKLAQPEPTHPFARSEDVA